MSVALMCKRWKCQTDISMHHQIRLYPCRSSLDSVPWESFDFWKSSIVSCSTISDVLRLLHCIVRLVQLAGLPEGLGACLGSKCGDEPSVDVQGVSFSVGKWMHVSAPWWAGNINVHQASQELSGYFVKFLEKTRRYVFKQMQKIPGKWPCVKCERS